MKSNLVEKSSIFNKTRKFTQIVVSLEKDIYFHLCLPEYIDLFLNKLPSKEDFISKFQPITIDLFSHPIPTPYHWLAHSFVCVFSYDKKIIKIFGKVEDTYYWWTPITIEPLLTIPFEKYTPEYLLSCLTFLK